MWGCGTKEETPRWRRGEGRGGSAGVPAGLRVPNSPVFSGNIFFHLLLINTVYTLGPARGQMRTRRPLAAGTAGSAPRARRAQLGLSPTVPWGPTPRVGRVDPVDLVSSRCFCRSGQRALRSRVRNRRGCVRAMSSGLRALAPGSGVQTGGTCLSRGAPPSARECLCLGPSHRHGGCSPGNKSAGRVRLTAFSVPRRRRLRFWSVSGAAGAAPVKGSSAGGAATGSWGQK